MTAHPSTASVPASCVLCLFRQVQASNDASLLYHKLALFFIIIIILCSYSTLLLFIQSRVTLPPMHEFLTLPLYLLRLYAEGIHFMT